MWLAEENGIQKQNLVLERPYVNASGTLGFFPDRHALDVLAQLGAFITNPISRRPRLPAGNRCQLPFTGGFLLHTGHPNPGLSQAIKRFSRRWAFAELPIIIHLLVESPEELTTMVRKIEGLENILSIELGLPPGVDADLLFALMKAGAGELPLIPCISPEQIPLLLDALTTLKLAAVHLVEPRGTLPAQAGELVTGRLFGPAIFPVMLSSARLLVEAGLQVFANGGVRARWQADTLFGVGVAAVGLGSVLWKVDQGTIF
jgi:dihydroorotate dehydrogenase (NAD+) catalytic subunit